MIISEGYKYLESFEKDYLPVFTYKVNDLNKKDESNVVKAYEVTLKGRQKINTIERVFGVVFALIGLYILYQKHNYQRLAYRFFARVIIFFLFVMVIILCFLLFFLLSKQFLY